MLRLAFDFIIAWREIRARPNAYAFHSGYICYLPVSINIASIGSHYVVKL